MKKYRVPILTEEYRINVCIGTEKEILRELKSFTGKDVRFDDKLFRGRAYDCYPNHNPLVVVNIKLSYPEALATLAHEACHAMDYIIEFIGIDDKSGEFRAHGIAAVLRTLRTTYFNKKNSAS